MIAANETVASHLFYQELPSIYRVHGKPKEEKLEEFLGFVSHMGYQITGKNKLTYSTEIQKILKQLKEQCDENEYLIVSDLLLRSMKKAKYSNENEGHFGLGSKCYSHFTSPIRRYPDTILHRLLKVYLFNGDISENTQKKWNSKLIEISDSTSNSEVKAVECEREVESMKMAEYMESHIGEQYKGVISGITNFGLFIKLDNLIEGLVHISELNDDHYNYNKNILAMVGERTNKTYKIGDKVEIEVIKASKETKNIDFKLVKRG